MASDIRHANDSSGRGCLTAAGWMLLVGEAAVFLLIGVILIISGLDAPRERGQFEFAFTRQELLAVGTVSFAGAIVLAVTGFVVYVNRLAGGVLLFMMGLVVPVIGLQGIGPTSVFDAGVSPVVAVLVMVPGVLFILGSSDRQREA